MEQQFPQHMSGFIPECPGQRECPDDQADNAPLASESLQGTSGPWDPASRRTGKPCGILLRCPKPSGRPAAPKDQATRRATVAEGAGQHPPAWAPAGLRGPHGQHSLWGHGRCGPRVSTGRGRVLGLLRVGRPRLLPGRDAAEGAAGRRAPRPRGCPDAERPEPREGPGPGRRPRGADRAAAPAAPPSPPRRPPLPPPSARRGPPPSSPAFSHARPTARARRRRRRWAGRAALSRAAGRSPGPPVPPGPARERSTLRSGAPSGGPRKCEPRRPGRRGLRPAQSRAMGPEGTRLPRGRALPVLVLTLLLAAAPGQGLDFHPEWGFDSYEITVPRKLSSRAGEQGPAGRVSYLLPLKDEKHVVRLWPKRFLLPRHLQVFSFSEHDELLEDHPYLPMDCNFGGSVEGSEESEATLSTCTGGLRGILKIDTKLYQIEPLKASSSFEHVVYLLKKEEFISHTCDILDDVVEIPMGQQDNMARLREFYDSYKHPKYMELGMIFDHDRYVFVNSNLTQVISDAIILTAIMDTYFQELSLRIHLKALEVWTNGDLINVNKPNLTEVLGLFVIYRRDVLNARLETDWMHLYVKRYYRDALGWSFGFMCTKLYGASASVFPNLNILAPGTWTTHELGHALGMQHDEKDCLCKGVNTCLMGFGRSGWSNCSFIAYFKQVTLGAACLNNIPGIGYVIQRCGNQIVEDNEECDCGSVVDCEMDRCCQPDCKLKPGANCSVGLCCHECLFRPSGYVCREEENECDLAEYCNGASGLCPNDTYKQNGTPCKYEAVCFSKRCQSRFMQCQSIFGPDAQEAPSQCYTAVNLLGDQFGNCDILGSRTYRKCGKDNAVCGRLQCINVKTVPDMPEHTSIISTHLWEENLMCWGIGYHSAMVPLGIPDMGAVGDGTSCGPNLVCFNRTCADVSVLNYDCLPEKCNRRGVCNNRKNCHCMYGWAPPFCEDDGYGGSIDSGPPGPLKVEMPSSFQVVSVMLLRLIFLLISAIVVFYKPVIGKYFRSTPEEIPPSGTGDQPPKAKAAKSLKK
ncbi:disintegrin and metalloproteinase domain-containing protein 30 [Tamandua tetradactyla]|uniref:disintegrin and metalloproteinase domain-containing protein 30 n=1 Tax=Tamandua tetradactyla TaxID=48850 RepID=UPI004053EC40